MAIADELALLKSTKASIKEKLTNKDLQPTEDLYNNGRPSVGCVWTSVSDKAGHLLGKVYSIRLYNRLLTEEELYNNMVVDYMRFKIPIMDEFKINLTNDLGEKIQVIYLVRKYSQQLMIVQKTGLRLVQKKEMLSMLR